VIAELFIEAHEILKFRRIRRSPTSNKNIFKHQKRPQLGGIPTGTGGTGTAKYFFAERTGTGTQI